MFKNQNWIIPLCFDDTTGDTFSVKIRIKFDHVIEENFDIVIACNRKDYTYYIQNLDEILGDGCRNWLFNSHIIDVALKSSPCLFHRVVLPDMSGGSTMSLLCRIPRASFLELQHHPGILFYGILM